MVNCDHLRAVWGHLLSGQTGNASTACKGPGGGGKTGQREGRGVSTQISFFIFFSFRVPVYLVWCVGACFRVDVVVRLVLSFSSFWFEVGVDLCVGVVVAV